MSYHYYSIQSLSNRIINYFQSILNYDHWNSIHFNDTDIGKIATTGFILGLLGGVHLCLFLVCSGLILSQVFMVGDSSLILNILTIWQWSCYFLFLMFFHFMEFFITAIYQPAALSYDSYLVNHSRSYTVAVLFGWFEFWIESLFFQEVKCNYYISILGFILLLLGQCIRSLSMSTCGSNFSHNLMSKKEEGHNLVTTGIYSFFRHPSYFGWFYWCLGTQLVLCNPVSFIAYLIASWSFFNERIEYEENVLLKIYGEQYSSYVKRTIIGIPGIYSRNRIID